MVWWTRIVGGTLEQGDYLPDCDVPVFPPNYGEGTASTSNVPVSTHDVIVLTHSCDLVPEQGPTPELVAVAAINPLERFCSANPSYGHANQRNLLRAGRMPSLHLLASPVDPGDNQLALVVDFKEIYSLPYAYVVRHAAKLGLRYRLNPPYLEHFSQAFARFFMRVGLPSGIPKY